MIARAWVVLAQPTDRGLELGIDLGRAPMGPSVAILESGDDRLGGAHALGEVALAEAGLGAKVVDELTEREVVFDPGLTAALLA